MKNKVLKLCKRLNKTTLNEVLPILGATEDEIKPIFEELESEGLLTNHNNVYYYIDEKVKKQNLPVSFQYINETELELIIKYFSANLPCTTTALLLNRSNKFIENFNKFFREKIYNIQLKELEMIYNFKPQQVRIRTFFDKNVYFYYYNNHLYVSKSKLKKCPDETKFTQSEILEFKRLYSYLRRKIYHNSMTNYVHMYIAEELWRINKDFKVMCSCLYTYLN